MKQNPSKVTLFLSNSPFSGHSQYDAYQFAKNHLDQGGEVNSIFFFSDAVYLANNLIQTPYDEFNIAESFYQLHDQYQTKLHLCIGACQKRGIINEEMANNLNENANVHEGFQLVGLSQFYQCVVQSDELVIFNHNQKINFSVANKDRFWVFYPKAMPYENYYFRELFELALAIASFDEKIYFVIDNLAKENLKQTVPEYSKNISKMLKTASLFDIHLIDESKYKHLKGEKNLIELSS